MPEINNKKANNKVAEFLAKDNIIAVVGVSADQQKYGYKVFFDLLAAGYKVYAVHPAAGEVNGQRRWPSLSSLPEKPDVVCLVVPPAVGEKVVRQAKAIGVDKIWLQPGADSPEIINYCQQHGLKVLAGVCIMVERRQSDK